MEEELEAPDCFHWTAHLNVFTAAFTLITLIIHLLSSLMPDIKGRAALSANWWRSCKQPDETCCDSIICSVLRFSSSNEWTRRNLVSHAQHEARIVEGMN